MDILHDQESKKQCWTEMTKAYCYLHLQVDKADQLNNFFEASAFLWLVHKMAVDDHELPSHPATG